MFVDISIEYNCSFEEFILDNVFKFSNDDKWICYHTDNGKNFLSNFINNLPEKNIRIKVPNDKIILIREKMKNSHITGLINGFFYKDKKHKHNMNND